jgi:hypothetical protein
MHRFVYILVFLATTTWAGTVYKSVDEQGNVIYSEEPPAGSEAAETLDMPPKPSEEEVEEARERDKKLQQYLEDTNKTDAQPEERQSTAAESSTKSGEAVVGSGARARREEERRRAIWGKDWPIHHPMHK